MPLHLPCLRGLIALPLLLLVACRSGPGPLDADPLTAARDDRLTSGQRAAMVERAWADAAADRTNRRAVRRDLKDLAWVVQHPAAVRLAALRALASDTDEGAEEETRSTVFFMLPLEPDPKVTEYLAELSASRGWTTTTPSLVRSLSRPRAGADADRPEYRALRALHPDRRVEEVVYDVFLNPPPKAALAGVVSPERVRADAWDLLRRLDADGSVRARLLEDAVTPGSDPADVLRRSLRELRVLPTTGDEYLWLVSLAGGDAKRAAWWASTSAIVQRLDPQRVGRLNIRHLEPIRFTAEAHPDRLERTREELVSMMRQRLEGRTVVLRQRERGQVGANRPERFEASADRLSWGDLVALLAVDDALADPAVRAALFAQRELDRADTQAEYGGLLRVDGPASQRFAAVLYPPRQGERRGDREFVAPPDMFTQGDHALAHYHFHAQEIRNAAFAGPSGRDMAYAARFGRVCVVFTSTAIARLNADYYQPDGVVIDLGELLPPPAAAAR